MGFNLSAKKEILLYSNLYFLFSLLIAFMEGIKIEKEIQRDIGKDIKSKQSFNNKKLNEQQQDTIQVIKNFL